MEPAMREECVRQLLMDERFVGVLGMVESLRERYVVEGCDQALAGSPGKQSHSWGSVNALLALLVELSVIEGRVERKRKGAAQVEEVPS